ncbi:hypothetical protein BFW01_g1258 [Lasiodiplodia theobromae]|uniref:Fucose-specific lectin n=1 Tax=Lasiodiplodia theobromae TaxID=45133 RepID=A0A8H7MDK7_9PEZI|nr:hypothetical protein BFW01_g1258 [Lasiodiplodia theobromae]
MPSPPKTPPPHSTLEVDVTAQRENERQAHLWQDNASLIPKGKILLADEGVDAPQVAHDGTLPIPTYPSESAPQVIDTNTLPEPMILESQRTRPPSRICGLRKRSFWIIIAVAVAIVVAVAVGAGVGVSQADSKNSEDNQRLLRTSKLAALRSGEIYLSVWNSSSPAWAAFPVVTDGNDVLRRTPIAADVQWKSANVYRHHIYYFDANNVIRGKAADTPYTESWDDDNGFNGKNYGGDGHSLATYSRECETCYAANAVVYFDGNLQYATPQTKGGGQLAWNQNPFPAKLPQPANGTQLVMKALDTGTTDNGKFIVMFMTIKGRKLAKLLYNVKEDNWESETVDTTVGARSSIAAFTTGTFINGNSTDANYTMQVFYTHPSESSGGVTLSSYSSRSSAWNFTVLESGFENVLNGSGLAANQAGRVYGTVITDAGDLQLMEWAWDMGNGTYSMTGPVNTNAVT